MIVLLFMPTVIAITGGPSGGKTTLLQILQKEFGHDLSLVPEAASILYRGGFPRTGTLTNRRHVQRAIFQVQRELEDLARDEEPPEVIICDRGSLDSIAYWPASEADFFDSLHTSREEEFKRYDWVLHLDTAPESDFDTNNPIRTENFEEAVALNSKTHSAWLGHPRLLVIPNNIHFLDKMTKAKMAVEYIRQGKSHDWIMSQLFPSDEDRSG